MYEAKAQKAEMKIQPSETERLTEDYWGPHESSNMHQWGFWVITPLPRHFLWLTQLQHEMGEVIKLQLNPIFFSSSLLLYSAQANTCWATDIYAIIFAAHSLSSQCGSSTFPASESWISSPSIPTLQQLECSSSLLMSPLSLSSPSSMDSSSAPSITG